MAAAASAETIAERIAQAIREKVLSPGAPLVQEDLARRFDVSRSPVREALRILATEGLVEMSPGGGAVVRRLDSAELEELYDLRIMIEPTIAAPLTARITSAELARLRELVATMEQLSDIGRWMRANFEFHVRLYEASGRTRTQEILRGLLAAVQPYSQENIDQLGGRTQADLEHRDMIAAIEQADAPRLAELLRVHLLSAKNRVAQALADSDEELDPLAALRG